MASRPPKKRFWPLAKLETDPLPIDHGDPYGPPRCQCWLCEEWRARLEIAGAASKKAQGHSRSCMCEVCQEKRRTEINLLVVENIRDLYSELSWVAGLEQWDESWIEWFLEEISNPEKTKGYWSSQSTHMPMAHWLAKWDSWRKARGILDIAKPVQINIRRM